MQSILTNNDCITKTPILNNFNSILGCSAFCITNKNNILLAKNLDVPFTDGYLISNSKELDKKSLLNDEVKWKSIYGSITLNIIGDGFPMGGMNEKGLVIEHLHMPDTIYPNNIKHKILEFEFIQYILDTCKTVEEVLNKINIFEILQGRIEMHFITADNTGNTALIEFINGSTIKHTDNFRSLPVVTNNFYSDGIIEISKYKNFGGTEIIPFTKRKSLDRFAILCTQLKDIQNTNRYIPNKISEAFNMLDSVLDDTLISIVYDPSNLKINFKTNKNQDIKIFDINNYSYDTNSHRIMLNIHEKKTNTRKYNQSVINNYAEKVIIEFDDFLQLMKYKNAILKT